MKLRLLELKPPGLVTTTAPAPLPAGTTAWMLPEVCRVMRAIAPPMVTKLPDWKFEPSMLMG